MSIEVKMRWMELPEGGIIPESGTAQEYHTGSWRNERPVLDLGKCIHCLQCWIYCPDGCMIVVEEKLIKIDLQHCKGCGICVTACPPKVAALIMVPEGAVGDEAQPVEVAQAAAQ